MAAKAKCLQKPSSCIVRSNSTQALSRVCRVSWANPSLKLLTIGQDHLLEHRV